MDGRMFHQKCACHIFSLTVKTGLKITSVNNLICKFKDNFHHIYSNNIKKQDFHALWGRLNLSKLRVPWDINIRWNSTYRMLHRVLPYKHAISKILRNSPERFPLLCSTGEWDQLEQLHTFFRSFYSTQPSNYHARTYHPRINCFDISIWYPRFIFFSSCIFLL
jgi:hypothetical protein